MINHNVSLNPNVKSTLDTKPDITENSEQSQNFLDTLKKTLSNLYGSYSSLPALAKLVLILSIVVGTGFRYYNLFNLGYHFDTVDTQYNWGKAGFEMGIFGFWKNYVGFFDYSLFSLIFETIIYWISKLFGGTDYAFVAVLKSFNWLVEILFSWYVYHIVDKYSGEKNPSTKKIKAYMLAALSYLTPALWFVTGVWGQNDTLIAFLSAISLEIVYLPQFKLNLTSRFSNTTWLKNTFQLLDDNFFWSGVVLAISFWIKQQAVLVVPILALYHLRGKTWNDLKNFLVWVLPFLGFISVGYNLYNNGQWFDTFFLGSFLLIVFSIAMLAFLNKKDAWKDVRIQSFGFLLVSVIIIIPCAIFNYTRLGSTLFAVVGRQDIISNGGATMWRLLNMDGDATRYMIYFGTHGFLTVSMLGLSIYLIVMATLYYAFLQIDFNGLKSLNLAKIVNRSLDFKNALILTAISSSAYFIFFTKMHSRYLHFGIVFGILSLAVINLGKDFYKWLALTLIVQIAYTLNQMSVYGDQIGDPNNAVKIILAGVNSDYWNLLKLCALVFLLCFLGFYSISKDLFIDKSPKVLDKN
jgi:hypothetical protein